jgi:two-component system cell cycle sensor histidine kinase/response regulator CckA
MAIRRKLACDFRIIRRGRVRESAVVAERQPALDLLDPESDRSAAEKVLHQTLKRLEDLKAAVDESAIVLITNPEGVITYANERASDISGYPQEELLGKNPRIMGSRRHPVNFFVEMWEIIAGGGIWRGEIRNRSRRGSDYWLDTTIVPFLDEGGLPIHYMAISFDITARKLAEEKLRALSTDRMALLDAASVARVVPWSMGIDAGTLKVGDSSFTVLGQPAAAFHAYPGMLRELLKSEDQRLLTQALAEAKAGHTGSFEAPMKRGENQSIWTRWIIERREGNYHGVIQDITEQHNLHAQLLQSQKLESLGTLVGGITHDFNNILMGILGYTEVLSCLPDTPIAVQKGVEVIRRAAERGRNLVNQLLKFSRRDVSTKVMASLNESVSEVLELMTLPGENRIHLELELDPELPEVLMDPGQICQVILNLAVNARDAIPGQGMIRFRTGITVLGTEQAMHLDRRPGPYVFVDVEDTGTGMPSEVLARIFEPFFTTKGIGKGTGLGLSVAHGIVGAHGGFLKCESHPGRGTSFRVMLPQITTEVLPEEAGERDAAPRSVRILLMDDAGTPRSTAAELLAYMGHSVVPQAAVDKALEAHRALPFQLLVVNLEMDGGHGLDRLIALQDACPELPVLAASPRREPPLHGVRRMPCAVLRWPFQSVELLSAIQRAIN